MKGQRKYDAVRFGVGCYVDCSCGSADSLNRRTVHFAQDFGFKPGRNWDTGDSEDLSWSGDKAVEHLNALETRSFMSWQFEDNSLFLMADVDGAREDVGFVSHSSDNHDDECNPDDAAYPADDYEGEWLHVSDHGNATLYVRKGGKDTEIWGVV